MLIDVAFCTLTVSNYWNDFVIYTYIVYRIREREREREIVCQLIRIPNDWDWLETWTLFTLRREEHWLQGLSANSRLILTKHISILGGVDWATYYTWKRTWQQAYSTYSLQWSALALSHLKTSRKNLTVPDGIPTRLLVETMSQCHDMLTMQTVLVLITCIHWAYSTVCRVLFKVMKSYIQCLYKLWPRQACLMPDLHNRSALDGSQLLVLIRSYMLFILNIRFDHNAY